jgi:hypothetical protein
MTTEEIQINLTEEEAKHILHALTCTNARNSYGNLVGILDTVVKVETELFNKLHKDDTTRNTRTE